MENWYLVIVLQMLVSIFYEDRQQRNRKKKRTGWKGRGLGAK